MLPRENSEQQTFPKCTVQSKRQWSHAFYSPKLQPILLRLCKTGTSKSLLVPSGSDTSLFWDSLVTAVEAGADDLDIYQKLRAIFHTSGSQQERLHRTIDEDPVINLLQSKRVQRRVGSTLKMLRASPFWGTNRRPTAVLDVGCGRDVHFIAALGQALCCAAFAIDTMWEPGDVPEIPGMTYSRILPDTKTLPFPSDSLDVVTAMMMLHHVPLVDTFLAEIHRILKPGGHLLVREHDCNDPELGVIIDLQHGLHNFVWPDFGQQGGASPSVRDFVDEHWAHYRSKEEWRAVMANRGFQLMDSNEGWLDAIDRSYYDIFVKESTTPQIYTVSLPNQPPYPVERIKVGVVPHDASLPVLRSYVYRFANAENNIKAIPKEKRLFAKEQRQLVPRPVILMLLGQVGDSFQVRLVHSKLPLGSNLTELPSALRTRVFDTKEAAERLCQHLIPNEFHAGAVELLSIPFQGDGSAKLHGKLRVLLQEAKRRGAVLLFNKFAHSPLHKLLAALLKEVNYDLPVVCICREVEANFFDSSNGKRPTYTWVAPGPEAALALDPDLSATDPIYKQELEQDPLNDVVTHAIVTSGDRVGADLPLMFDLAKMLAGYEGAETFDGVPRYNNSSAPSQEKVVSLLINGGMTMLKAASLATENTVPVVALTNTGRLADVTALTLMRDSPDFNLTSVEPWVAQQLRSPSLNTENHRTLDAFLSGNILCVDNNSDDPDDVAEAVLNLLSKDPVAGEVVQLAMVLTPQRRIELLAKLRLMWLRADYILSLRALPRHQDVPTEAFVRVNTETPDNMPVAVSHPWLDRLHPDNEDHFQLLLLQARLIKQGITGDTPVFYDYLSLPQRRLDGHDDRTVEQYTAFQQGLDSMNTVFAYARVIIIECVPPGVTNSLAYHERGWCFFEVSLAIMGGVLVLSDDFSDRKWKMWQDKLRVLGGGFDSADVPDLEAFCSRWIKELSSKTFLNDDDHARVAQLFKDSLERHLMMNKENPNTTAGSLLERKSLSRHSQL